MNRPSPWMLAFLLFPGLGLILIFIGAVIYIAVAQSFGYYNLLGDSGFTLEFWQKTLERRADDSNPAPGPECSVPASGCDGNQIISSRKCGATSRTTDLLVDPVSVSTAPDFM